LAFRSLWKKIEKPSLKQIIKLVASLKTKKQTQRVLIANQPAPAALSIPDDACHYEETLDNLRTLTVREIARIQSFPDWYEIKSKVTTGGQQRKFEVPQYTQMGNAVPPFLGYALGKICNKILSI
jgi:DNA (cytosine-5)-methyltransferase 1